MKLKWEFGGSAFDLAFEKCGRGPGVLLLPAPSTLSTRDEMRGLVDRMADIENPDTVAEWTAEFLRRHTSR